MLYAGPCVGFVRVFSDAFSQTLIFFSKNLRRLTEYPCYEGLKPSNFLFLNNFTLIIMLSNTQKYFVNTLYSPQKHSGFVSGMEKTLGCSIPFRVMESPAFCSHDLKNSLAEAAVALAKECITTEYRELTKHAIQSQYTVQNEAEHPMFCVIDFAVSQVNGEYIPKLVELQGFPSLFGYEYLLSESFKSAYNIGKEFTPYFSQLNNDEYLHLLNQAIVGKHHPDNVCLLEFDPFNQKTLPDFKATELYTNVSPTDIREVVKVGDKLFHKRGGAFVPLNRIYNRAIVDELEENNVSLPFSWTDNLDVEWAGHPNWYFRMSKYSLPFLKHHSVPKTFFLNSLKEVPTNLNDFVLKPLYAFAGKGVNVNPTAQDIESIPESEQHNWVLMEKIHYAECLYTPLGMNKLEIRCMVIWLPDSPTPIPTISLVRSGRGAMMGARFNSIDWTGATLCFFGDE